MPIIPKNQLTSFPMIATPIPPIPMVVVVVSSALIRTSYVHVVPSKLHLVTCLAYKGEISRAFLLRGHYTLQGLTCLIIKYYQEPTIALNCTRCVVAAEYMEPGAKRAIYPVPLANLHNGWMAE